MLDLSQNSQIAIKKESPLLKKSQPHDLSVSMESQVRQSLHLKEWKMKIESDQEAKNRLILQRQDEIAKKQDELVRQYEKKLKDEREKARRANE